MPTDNLSAHQWANQLEKHFRAELDRGMAVADYAVGNAFFRNCTENMIPACQIWYTKSRMGWKETIVTESHEHRCYSMSTEEIVKEMEERANRLDVKIDLSID